VHELSSACIFAINRLLKKPKSRFKHSYLSQQNPQRCNKNSFSKNLSLNYIIPKNNQPIHL